MNLESAWVAQQVLGQSGIYSETLLHTHKKPTPMPYASAQES
jgi:hypothetical protein